MNIFTVKNI